MADESPYVAAMRRREDGGGFDALDYMAPMPQVVRDSPIDLLGARIKRLQEWRKGLPVDIRPRKGGATLIVRGKF
jgi:hypothetical protein